MTVAFWSIAGVMGAVALGIILRPLVRGGAARDPRLAALERAHRDGVLSDAELASKRAAIAAETKPATPAAIVPAIALAVVFVAGSAVIYRIVGEPRALDPVLASATPTLEDAAKNLAERLAETPDDAQDWLLLGRTYKEMQRFADARDALAKANRLAPDDVDAMVEYAEALALASPDRRLAGEARALLERALTQEPAHQRGQWLSGIAALQDERYADAASIWEKLLAQLPPESAVAESVKEQIAQARARAGLPALAERVAGAPATSTPTAAPNAESSVPADAGTRLVIEIGIDPALASRIEPGDTLFVFARAPQGPKMPLAIQRIPVPSFPATIVLDDTMGMMPALKLSQAPEVVVGARISKSGNAAPQSGDLEIISAPIAVASQRAAIKLVIANVVP